MIFLGDIAIPDSKCAADFKADINVFSDLFKDKTVVANLEGPLVKQVEEFRKQRILFNHFDSIDLLNLLNVKAVSLANNHIGDIEDGLDSTLEALNNNNILHFGAGYNKSEAIKIKELIVDGNKYFFIGCCWDLMLSNKDKKVKVNTFDPHRLLKEVTKLRSNYTEAKIIVMPHWNFDLELYPFPLYRNVSRALIDSGANAIIGSHSHCVQGIEIYKGAPIAYCLGNFMLPDYEYFNKKLKYPEFVKDELALEWKPDSNEVILHWFKYSIKDEKHRLEHIESVEFNNNIRIKELTPYSGFNDDEYIKWFKANRRKNFMLPVYKDYREINRNYFKNIFIKSRLIVAKKLASYGLRSGIE